ncbi:MAG TPA: hypothetical protein VFL57_21920, partial [Bryobacteraceae bacterium]|nr:hypothetical protein [Bryobacteraceae bacterium]
MTTSTILMKTKRKRTRIGNSRLRASLAAALSALLVAPPVFAFGRKEKPAQTPEAVIAGTVFRTPGFALAGAEITVVPKQSESGGVKLKKIQVLSSRRGEWAVRVPAVPMEYSIYVKCSGYESQSKIVAIEGEQRRELSF